VGTFAICNSPFTCGSSRSQASHAFYYHVRQQNRAGSKTVLFFFSFLLSLYFAPVIATAITASEQRWTNGHTESQMDGVERRNHAHNPKKRKDKRVSR
jgi:hypothetical protein